MQKWLGTIAVTHCVNVEQNWILMVLQEFRCVAYIGILPRKPHIGKSCSQHRKKVYTSEPSTQNTRKFCRFAKAKGFIILFWECSLGVVQFSISYSAWTLSRLSSHLYILECTVRNTFAERIETPARNIGPPLIWCMAELSKTWRFRLFLLPVSIGSWCTLNRLQDTRWSGKVFNRTRRL